MADHDAAAGVGHSAGIRHYLDRDDAFPGLLAGNPHFASVTAGLAIFKDDPLLFEPGTRYAYSSYGWNVIAAVIEGASRQEFLTFVQQHVLDRLGLRAIGPDHVRAIVPNRTRFYTRDGQGRLLNAPYIDSSYKWAGGGFLGNAEDLVRLARRTCSPASCARRRSINCSRRACPSAAARRSGIGWRIGRDAEGRRIAHHGGTIEGGRALLLAVPRREGRRRHPHQRAGRRAGSGRAASGRALHPVERLLPLGHTRTLTVWR